MNGIETIICVLVVGLAIMMCVCGILICVSNLIDRKMRTKTELQLKVFDKEMEQVNKMIDGAIKGIGEIFGRKIANKQEEIKNRGMTSKQDGFGII